MKLLIATTNPGKLAEIKEFLSDLPITLVDLASFSIPEKPQETGKTFEENAILKARFYAKRTGLPALGDDGGFEIDALGGEPGVKSHRWIHGDREDDDEELIKYAFRKMRGLPRARRGAQLRAAMALVFPDGRTFTATAATRGIVPDKPSRKRVKGFPYRSILFIAEIGKYYNQDVLTPEETNKYNHRKQALDQLKPILQKMI